MTDTASTPAAYFVRAQEYYPGGGLKRHDGFQAEEILEAWAKYDELCQADWEWVWLMDRKGCIARHHRGESQ